MKNVILKVMLCFLGISVTFGQQQISEPSTNQEIGKLIKNDIDYVDKNIVVSVSTIAYPVAEYEAMIERCEDLTSRLIIHNKLAMGGKMTKEQMVNWKRDIVQAKLLKFKVSDFLATYSDGGYLVQKYIKKSVIADYDNFSKELSESSRYVGL